MQDKEPEMPVTSQASPTGQKDKYRSSIKVGDKVKILTLRDIRRKDKYGTIVAFTAKRVQIRTGSPPQIVVRADSNLARVIDI